MNPTGERIDLSIVIPVKNEEANVQPLVKKILELCNRLPSFEILFVNDGSTDSTEQHLKELSLSMGCVRYISVEKKEGGATIGSALRLGFKSARGEKIVIMDGDLTHDPAYILEMLAALEGADMVLGSRYIEGGFSAENSRLKGFLSRFVSRLTCYLFGVPVHDSSHSYRALRAIIIPKLDLCSKGFIVNYEMTIKAHMAGLRLQEIPVKNLFRAKDSSKFRMGEAFRDYSIFIARIFIPALARRLKLGLFL